MLLVEICLHIDDYQITYLFFKYIIGNIISNGKHFWMQVQWIFGIYQMIFAYLGPKCKIYLQANQILTLIHTLVDVHKTSVKRDKWHRSLVKPCGAPGNVPSLVDSYTTTSIELVPYSSRGTWNKSNDNLLPGSPAEVSKSASYGWPYWSFQFVNECFSHVPGLLMTELAQNSAGGLWIDGWHSSLSRGIASSDISRSARYISSLMPASFHLAALARDKRPKAVSFVRLERSYPGCTIFLVSVCISDLAQ